VNNSGQPALTLQLQASNVFVIGIFTILKAANRNMHAVVEMILKLSCDPE